MCHDPATLKQGLRRSKGPRPGDTCASINYNSNTHILDSMSGSGAELALFAKMHASYMIRSKEK
jgi:hypothetical protein